MSPASDDDVVGCGQTVARNRYVKDGAEYWAGHLSRGVYDGDYNYECWEEYICGLLSKVSLTRSNLDSSRLLCVKVLRYANVEGSSYTFNNKVYSVGDVGQCYSRLQVGQVVEYMTHSESSWFTTFSTVESASPFAFGIPLNGWLFPDPTSSAESTTATATTTNTAESIASASSSGTDVSSAPTSSGLSTGAKAGIGIGVALGALAVLAVVGLLLFRRRRRRRESPPAYGGGDDKNTPVGPSEMDGSTPKSNVAVAELPEGPRRPVELP